jgi:homoserine kinase type II
MLSFGLDNPGWPARMISDATSHSCSTHAEKEPPVSNTLSDDIRKSLSDNAGGGRRGERATPTRELFVALRDAYGFDESAGYVDLGGSSCLNLLVPSNHRRYVVRVYRPYVSAARLDDIHRVSDMLRAGGIPCARPLLTRDSRRWIALDDRLVEVAEYIEHNGCMDSPERLAIGLPLLGRIHSILQDTTLSAESRNPLFANYIAPESALEMTRKGCARIRGWGPTDDERALADAAEELADRVVEAERDLLPGIPQQPVHGDFWHNNVLFGHDRVVLVTDLDFMGERMRIDDLALTLYFASDYFAPDAPPDEWMASLRRLALRYERGLDQPLSEAERAALPSAIARQPLWSIGGWVALLDDERAARRHASDMLPYVRRALDIIRHLDRWQAAFREGRHLQGR